MATLYLPLICLRPFASKSNEGHRKTQLGRKAQEEPIGSRHGIRVHHRLYVCLLLGMIIVSLFIRYYVCTHGYWYLCYLVIYQLRDAENLHQGFLRNVLAKWRCSWSNSNCWWLEPEFLYQNRTCIVLRSPNCRCICKSSLKLLPQAGWKRSTGAKIQKLGNWLLRSTIFYEMAYKILVKHYDHNKYFLQLYRYVCVYDKIFRIGWFSSNSQIMVHPLDNLCTI